MANIDVAWEVEGIISAEESVSAMIQVIQSKGIKHSGTFWTWENKVGRKTSLCVHVSTDRCTLHSNILGDVECLYLETQIYVKQIVVDVSLSTPSVIPDPFSSQ